MMAKIPETKHQPVLAAVEARVAARVISTLLVSVSGAITLVAIAYAVYGALQGPLSPPGASAATALVFAVVTAALAVIGPKLIKSRASTAKGQIVAARPSISSATLRTAAEVGFVVITAIADAAWQHRRDHKT